MKKIFIGIVLLGFIAIVTVFIINVNKAEIVENNESYKLENENNLNKVEKHKKVMLADILKNENEFLMVECNINNADDIINRQHLKSGIFVEEKSRDKLLEIINIATGNSYSINNEGYLLKPDKENMHSYLEKKMNNYIDDDKTIVVKIGNTYKGLLNDELLLDFMIERTMYVQSFKFNNNIRIIFINPERLKDITEDLSEKEIYEEVLQMM